MTRFREEGMMILAMAQEVHPWAFSVVALAGIVTGVAAVWLTMKLGLPGFLLGVALILGTCGWIAWKYGII